MKRKSRQNMQSRRRALAALSKGAVSVPLLNSFLQGCANETNSRSGEVATRQHGSGNLATSLTGNERFLIVLTCFGGASIIDSMLAMTDTEVTAAGGNAASLNCFPAAQVQKFDNSPLRAVKVDATIASLGNFKIATDQTDFVRKHMQDMLVVATEVTSVNHAIAQKRAVTGNDALQGRTLQEIVAAKYGKNLPVANLGMASGGFGTPGIDDTLEAYAKQMFVVDPLHWSLGLHSTAGLTDAPSSDLLLIARDTRLRALEGRSRFADAFGGAGAIKRWLSFRERRLAEFEQLRLIDKLFVLPDSAPGIVPDPEVQKLREAFPNYAKDNLQAQAILAYLAITRGISCSVSLGPDSSAAGSSINDFYNTPIAFDFSHSDHRGTQAMMWQRVMQVADKLIDLLKQREFSNGESFWDRTALYFASDFGRDKVRPANAVSFSTGHHLNNAAVIVSPMAKGNTVLGGIDYATGLTYGFDGSTGIADRAKKISERELFAGMLSIMGVDPTTAGLPSMNAMAKKT